MNNNFINDKLKIISMEDITATEVEWLWYPIIPMSKITIVQGDPGQGKTTVILQIASILSRGESLPCSNEKREPINIIYQSAEDGLSDTIKPRLEKAGADCSRIKVIDETNKPLSMADVRIEQAIKETKAQLVILDPIQGYLGAGVDMHRANEIRPVMKKLSNIAERYNCAVVLIGHMNKANGAKSTYRGLGSIDFQAAARSVLIVGKSKEDPRIRVIAHGKSSLAPEGRSIAFELSEDNGFNWLGYYDISVDDLLSDSRENKISIAERLLKDILSEDMVKTKVIMSKAQSRGISQRTMEQAKANLGVKSKRVGKHSHWFIP